MMKWLSMNLVLSWVFWSRFRSSGLVKSPNETTFLSQGLENVPLSITHHFGLDQIPVYEEPPSDKDRYEAQSNPSKFVQNVDRIHSFSFGTHFVSKYYVKNQLNKVFQSKFSGKIIHLVG